MATDWRANLVAHGSALARETFDDPLGVGVTFGDGCDVFWALPGEVISTVPIPAGGPAAADEVTAAYDAIDAVRGQAVHVLRHYLASLRIGVDRSPDGYWGLELAGGASTSLSVGAYLTRVARDTGDVEAVVRTCLTGAFGIKPPSARRIARYLGTAGPPPDERRPDPDAATIKIPSTIRLAVTWMGLCKALDRPEALAEPGAAEAIASPRGRLARMLLLLDDRLPGVEAAADLAKPGRLGLRFADGEDDFEIDTRSRDVARRVRTDGPDVAADYYAAEFARLNHARARVLAAVRRAAVDRGWGKDEFGFPLAGVGKTIWLGSTHREVRFEPGESLTRRLARNDEAAALREAFASQNPAFAEACARALATAAGGGDPPPDLPDVSLQPKVVPAAPPLRDLDADVADEMDRFARQTLAAYLKADRTIWEYRNPDVYDPAVDTWARLQDWVAVAERSAGGRWPHPMATVILLDAGDPRGETLALDYLSRAEPHHEVSEPEVEIAWRFRHRRPDVAAKWFDPQLHDDVPYVEERARLGDPTAVRRRDAGRVHTDPEPDAESSAAALVALPADRRERVRRDLLAWARTDHRWAGPLTDRLRLALRFGWRDVADGLEANPFMLAGLLTIDRRADQFDEPGMLMARDFLLVWSRLAPSPFLARLVATAHATDLVGLAEEASRRSAVGKPDVQRNLASSTGVYRTWHAELMPALAIAWTRCRPSIYS